MGHQSSVAARVRRVVLDQPRTLGDGDCEALRPGLLGQPVNTITSLGYVGVGAWLAGRSGRRAVRADRSALAFAALTALAGAGSVAYHGPQFAGAQFLHDTPVYGVLGVGAAVPVWRTVRGEVAVPGWSTGLGFAIAGTTAAAGAAYLAGRTTSCVCRPYSWWQFHGLWHLGTAAAMGMWGAALWPAVTDVTCGGPGDSTDEVQIALRVSDAAR
ncbi:hypothetical protein BH10ACT3_BH10ACT3_16880 [soil metagenome]